MMKKQNLQLYLFPKSSLVDPTCKYNYLISWWTPFMRKFLYWTRILTIENKDFKISSLNEGSYKRILSNLMVVMILYLGLNWC